MLDWHLGMLETEAGDERPLGAADALTLARLWSCPLARRHPHPWLVVAGAASDLADGRLARVAGPTRLGRDLDSAADLALTQALLTAAIERGGVSAWLLHMERGRFLAGAAIELSSYFGLSKRPQAPADRELGAVLAAGGCLLAAAGRRRAADGLLAAAVGHRALIMLRSLRTPAVEDGCYPAARK